MFRARAAAIALVALFSCLGASGCADVDESEDTDSAAGAAVGSMPLRTTLHGAGGLIAYFDGGWEKPNVTLYRGNAKRTLRCEAQPFVIDNWVNNETTLTLRCFDTPAGSTSAESCQVIFNRKVNLYRSGGTDRVTSASAFDDFGVSCWNSDRTTTKQKAFLKFVLGDLPTTTVLNTQRTEPTAEQTYANGIPLAIKTGGKDIDSDPYEFSWRVMHTVADVAYHARINSIGVSAPGAKLALDAYVGNNRVSPKDIAMVDQGKVVDYPVMYQRIRAGLGIR